MRETGIHHMSHLDRLEDAADVVYEQKWAMFSWRWRWNVGQRRWV
jgi:hypothetical protein